METINNHNQGNNDLIKGERMSAAFHNELILDKIFSNLDVLNLKLARKVCRLWADIGSSQLGSKTRIVIGKISLPCSYPSLKLLPFLDGKEEKVVVVDTKIFKNLKINFSSFLDPSLNNAITWDATVKRMGILSQLNHSIVSLSLVNIPGSFLRSYFPSTFSTFEFRLLKKIRIKSVIESERLEDGLIIDDFPLCHQFKFKMLGQLEELDLGFYPQRISTRVKWQEEFRTVFQALINSSVNLKRLRILGCNFFPDLSTSKKLEELVFGEMPSIGDNNGSHSATEVRNELQRTIGQVKDTIVKLSLGWWRGDSPCFSPHEEKTRFHLPHQMPKLTTLMVNVSCFDAAWIHSDIIPNLKRLDISQGTVAFNAMSFEYFFLSLNDTPHKGIEEVKLHYVLDERFDGKPPFTLLPNVKILYLELDCEYMEDFQNQFRGTLESFLLASKNNVTYSEIRLDYAARDCGMFLDTLEILGLAFSGIRKLELRYGNMENEFSEEEYFTFTERIGRAFDSYSATDSIILDKFKIPSEVFDIITQIAGDRKKPIEFKDLTILKQIKNLK